MTPRTRTRLLWLLAALTAAHALASVAVFAAMGAFPPVALGISLVVYAIVLVGALALLATTPRRRLRRRAPRPDTRPPSASAAPAPPAGPPAPVAVTVTEIPVASRDPEPA